jgi:ABC-type transport system involved in multi-copper enzyme maturation permease subunit
MAIELLGYRSWRGELRWHGWACWPIVRTGLWIVLRRKIFWLLLALGLINFLLNFAGIYIISFLSTQNPNIKKMIGGFLEALLITSGRSEEFLDFMFHQGTVTMLLLAFAGSQLIGGDYQQGGLAFYLSRRIDRRHYVIGKLLTIVSLVLLITTVPALALYLEYGLLSDSLDYLRDNLRIVGGILSYGLIMGVGLSLLLAAIAAWVPRAVPLVMTWACVFILLPVVGENLRYVQGNRLWRLLSFWRDLRLLGKWCLDALVLEREEDRLAIWAAWIVPAICIACLVAFIHRVRAVEIVR